MLRNGLALRARHLLRKSRTLLSTCRLLTSCQKYDRWIHDINILDTVVQLDHPRCVRLYSTVQADTCGVLHQMNGRVAASVAFHVSAVGRRFHTVQNGRTAAHCVRSVLDIASRAGRAAKRRIVHFSSFQVPGAQSPSLATPTAPTSHPSMPLPVPSLIQADLAQCLPRPVPLNLPMLTGSRPLTSILGRRCAPTSSATYASHGKTGSSHII